MAHIAV